MSQHNLDAAAIAEPFAGKRVVIVLSGGMDSTALLHLAAKHAEIVQVLSFDYKQRHSRELAHAVAECGMLHLDHSIVEVPVLGRAPDSALTARSVDVPHGHYAADNMKATVVPNRNMVMVALAVSAGIQAKADAVLYGAHAGDHDIYPDCRRVFVESLARAVELCDWHPIRLVAPFVDISKADIVTVGEQVGTPWGRTWSCYEGGTYHCGNCGTCVERREAFKLAGVEDPTVYAEGARPLEELLAEGGGR